MKLNVLSWLLLFPCWTALAEPGAAAVFQKPVNRGELITALKMALADATPQFAQMFDTEMEAVAVAAA